MLIVAGSDSGGGAGIQADIKTVTALGGYAATAVTAITAQDTRDVYAVHPVPPEFVARQMEVVLRDIGADCVKTGMLHSRETVEAVLDVLAREAPDVPVVVDPVMVAKSGTRLLDDDAVEAMRRRLAPHAAMLTPNLPEAALLAERAVDTLDELAATAAVLLALGPASVLMKGGHLKGPSEEVVDLLVTPEGCERMTIQRLHTLSDHGTGCTLASAIACGLGQGMARRDAVGRAREYLWEAMRTAPQLGQGRGPLNHGHACVGGEE